MYIVSDVESTFHGLVGKRENYKKDKRDNREARARRVIRRW
jgi:hypothetical protein